MRHPLLVLVALSWCALVAAQEPVADYDYFELGKEGALLDIAEAPTAEAEAGPQEEEPAAEPVPVTEAITEKTTTTTEGPKGRRKLISVNPRDRKRRPNIRKERPTAATTTTEAPSSGSQTSLRGGNRRRRPSRREQTQDETTTQAPAPTRSRGRFSSRTRVTPAPTSAPSAPSRGSSRRSFSRGSATTEPPPSTTHRFSPRRRFRPQSSTKDEQEEETVTQAASSRSPPAKTTAIAPRLTEAPTTAPPAIEYTPERTTATPARPSPVPRIVETGAQASRSHRRRTTTPLPRIFRPLVVRPTTTPEPTTTQPSTTTRAARRGSSRYTAPPDPSHPNIQKDVAHLYKFPAPLSDSVKASSRSSTDNEVNGRHVTESPQTKATRKPATEAPVPTTTSKYFRTNYGQTDISYVGGEVVITEVGTMEDTPQYEINRILGGLGSRRRGLGRPQKPVQKQPPAKSPPVVEKVVVEEPVHDDYYDEYYYDY